MNFRKNSFQFLLSVLIITSCLHGCKDDEIVEPPPTPETNQRPSSFKVSIQEIGQSFAVIAWDAVKDPDGDPLFRSISFEGTTLVTDLTDDKPFKFENLKPSKTYSGTVSITDKKSDPVIVPFTFTTKKYITLFNKLISQYNDQYLEGATICKTPDGGYAVGANSSNGSDWGLTVLKYDSLGKEEWHSTRLGATAVSSMRQTKDGGFVIVGARGITKLNSSGVFQWEKVNSIPDQQYLSVIETDDLGYLVGGILGTKVPARGTITKYNANGTQEWETFFDGNVMSGCNQFVKAGSDYVIAGTHQKSNMSFELAVAKIDPQGNIYWFKHYPHEWQAFYIDVKIRSANNSYIIGTTSISPNASQAARMVKIAENGDIIWDKSFQWGGYETTCKGISSLDDGNFLFVGGYTNLSHYRTAIIVKINSNGDLIWKNDFKPDNYQDFIWEFRGVEQTADKGFILMGIKAWIWSGDGKDKGLWLVKTDDSGHY